MAGHNDKGRKAEDTAAEFLEQEGLKIIERNWRSGHREIDIIALDRDVLVIAEVKYREATGTERLEEIFSRTKQKNLVLAAEAFLRYSNLNMELRFDLLLVTPGDTEHIRDAFSAWDF